MDALRLANAAAPRARGGELRSETGVRPGWRPREPDLRSSYHRPSCEESETTMMHAQRHSDQGKLSTNGLPADIRAELRDWRRHLTPHSELTEPVDPARDHVRGNVDAAVVVVEYGSLGSPNESAEDRALRGSLREWIDERQVCVAFRHFPLIDSHAGAWAAARAAEAADRQGRFWDLHDALTDRLTRRWARELDSHRILAVARHLGLDSERLQQDMDAPEVDAKILRDFHSGIRSGVNGTPTFYVQNIRQDIESPDELVERIERAVAGDFAALWPPQHRSAEARGDLLKTSAPRA